MVSWQPFIAGMIPCLACITGVIIYRCFALFFCVFQDREEKREASKEYLTRAMGNTCRMGVEGVWRSSSSLRASIRWPENAKK